MEPVIAITMGDPAGIGPEIILKTFLDPESFKRNLLVVGDLAVLEAVQKKLGYDELTLNGVSGMYQAQWNPRTVNVWDLQLLSPADFAPGEVSIKAGDAAFKYVVEGIRLAKE